MRDPNRIDQVLHAVKALWLEYPDLRFFQLIAAIQGKDDLFYLEDDKAISLIYSRITQLAQQNKGQ